MIEELRVEGLGVIENVELELPKGLIALTGETGAGKSLLVQSLKLIAGSRASADLVRAGTPKAVVECTFGPPMTKDVLAILEELGVELEDERFIVRREISASGRSRAWVQGVQVPASLLERLASQLVAIHGQHQQHTLASPDAQRRLVDAFAGHHHLLHKTEAAYRRLRSAMERLSQVEKLAAQAEAEKARLQQALAEIDSVSPQAGEYEELLERAKLLGNAAEAASLLASLLASLSEEDGSVVERLARAEREASRLKELGLGFGAELALRLGEARVLVEEAVADLAASCGDLEGDPQAELDRINARLHALEQLMLKWGPSLDDVLKHREEMAERLRKLSSLSEEAAALKKELGEALQEFDQAARELDASRRDASRRLAQRAMELLKKLNMPSVRLEFSWSARRDSGSMLVRDGVPVAFDASGVEQCELLVSANPGEELRPLARVASGGELSRIHLALMCALRERNPARSMTLLFDEVDSGLGGATAHALGNLLAALAKTDQVLVVTHLPQVAALASCHIRVTKVVREGRTYAEAKPIAGRERLDEIARMISGSEVSESALEHARTLLEDGRG